MRSFVKKLKTKPEGVVTELIRQIIASQEGFHSRMSPYDKAIKIFEDRFSFGLTDHESMGFITLFADSPSAVQQFLSFTEHQRDLFVMRNKRWVKMDSASIVPGDLIRVESGGKRCRYCYKYTMIFLLPK